MFGDFFGSGPGEVSFSGSNGNGGGSFTGVTDGASGTVTFLDVDVTSFPNGGPTNVFNYSHGGSFNNQVIIDVPAFNLNLSGVNNDPFDLDIVGNPPPPTLNFTIDPNTLSAINDVANSPDVLSSYASEILTQEQLEDPHVTQLVSSSVEVFEDGQACEQRPGHGPGVQF